MRIAYIFSNFKLLITAYFCLSVSLSLTRQASNPIDVAARPGAVPHTLLQKDPRVSIGSGASEAICACCEMWMHSFAWTYFFEIRNYTSSLLVWKKNAYCCIKYWFLVILCISVFARTDNRSFQDTCAGKWLPFLSSAKCVLYLWPDHKV